MKITGLSLDSQLAILSQLPSCTLLGTIPLVCAQWNQLQPHACRQRRAVELIIARNEYLDASNFTLHPAQLDAPYAVALSATFPSVTHLGIYHIDQGFETLNEQLHLLQSWAPTLVSLFLTSNADNQAAIQGQLSPQFSDFLVRLLPLLDQMLRLKRLRLNIQGQLPPSADLSRILRRLVDVELNFVLPRDILVPQLLQHCSPNLQRLSLGYMRYFHDFLPLLTSPFLCSKLERLKAIHIDATQLAITVDHCINLQSLHIILFNIAQYAERMAPLAKLPRLTELKLTVAPIPTAGNGRLEPVLAPVPLPVLSSIRKLFITFASTLPSHEHFVQTTQLDQVFPQLQLIKLHWSSGSVGCQQCNANSSAQYSCIDAILRPVAHLETLQVAGVYLAKNNKLYNILPRLRRQ